MEAQFVIPCIFLSWVLQAVGQPCSANLKQYVYNRYGQYQDMQCCDSDSARGSGITWFKFNDESQSWTPLSAEKSDILFLERNATLAIKHLQFSDSGRYRCARTDGNFLHPDDSGMEFVLNVIACDQLARGPFPIAPLPCGVTSANVGALVMIPCTGYFGCDTDDVRIVSWFVKNKSSSNSSWAEVSAADDRITQTQIDSHDGVLASNLTVTNVKTKDSELQFMCVLYSTQYLEGQTNVFTSLNVVNDKQTVAGAFMLVPVIIIAAASAAVVVLTLLAMCACHMKAMRKLKATSGQTGSDVYEVIPKRNVSTEAVKLV